MAQIRFKVVTGDPPRLAGTCWLIRDAWDDFGHQTQYDVRVDLAERRYHLGAVKLGSLDDQVPTPPPEFMGLPLSWISIGQDESYYETLAILPEEVRLQVLRGLRDGVHDRQHLTKHRSKNVVDSSLMRFISREMVDHYYSVLSGDVASNGYRFSYHYPSNGPRLAFNVDDGSNPPTNVHILIGRNGVGKTRLLDSISAILRVDRTNPRASQRTKDDHGEILGHNELDEEKLFSRLISVSFSAFDSFAPPLQTNTRSGIRYKYIGLKHPKESKAEEGTSKSLSELRADFVNEARRCLDSARAMLWTEAIDILSSDPGFAKLGISQLAALDERHFDAAADKIFRDASSGHKIVLSTISQLVAAVEDRSLVLLDEPEAHLHPPLMASFTRALSRVLRARNGVALVATHSPVFLQEVPRSCVWVIVREGDHVQVHRPHVETYAENVGILTREVFQLEVTQSGHHAAIQDACNRLGNFDAVLRHFGGSMGSEGRAIALALLASR